MRGSHQEFKKMNKHYKYPCRQDFNAGSALRKSPFKWGPQNPLSSVPRVRGLQVKQEVGVNTLT